jgi:hypothetical protein
MSDFFRHYRVLAKLSIDLFATAVLLRRPSPAFHADAALLLMLAATTLAVYKPPGMTGGRASVSMTSGLPSQP